MQTATPSLTNAVTAIRVLDATRSGALSVNGVESLACLTVWSAFQAGQPAPTRAIATVKSLEGRCLSGPCS
jgi:hypothetical protein